MGGKFYALLGPVWKLRLGHEDQCEGNEIQFMRCDEAFARLQSCETKSEKLCNTALQRLGFSSMFLLWRHSNAAEAEAIYVSSVPIPALLMRSRATSVQQISDLGDADLAMRSVQKVNTFVQSDVRGVESNKAREALARTSFCC